MNILTLAETHLQKNEGKTPEDKGYSLAVIDRAIKIRKWLDISERNRKVAINRKRG